MTSILPLTSAQRKERFGTFRFNSDPTPTNPEHVRMLDGWAEGNIQVVKVPQLPLNGRPRLVYCHHLAAQPLLDVFAAWEAAGLLHHILSFDGAWAPRFKRQSGTAAERERKCSSLGEASLSNHAWGTAFDLNAKWLPLGQPWPKANSTGDTHPLEALANAHGWFAGGNFRSRPDPMHFELGRVATP